MNNFIKLAAPLEKESLINGPGIRMIIWNQGCKIRCPHCHNKETWDLEKGKSYSIEDIKKEIEKNKIYHDGITLSGGDPFLQPLENKEIADYAHSLNLNVWAYCGLTYEEIIKDDKRLSLLRSCDVLVDGPFILSERDITLKWRGSRNQRIIDIKKTKKKNEIILYE